MTTTTEQVRKSVHKVYLRDLFCYVKRNKEMCMFMCTSVSTKTVNFYVIKSIKPLSPVV